MGNGDPSVAWDERYAAAGYPAPDPWLREAAPLFRTGLPGPALELACGLGQNALWLASLGVDALGVDASEVAVVRARAEALRRGARVSFECAELGAGKPLPRSPGPAWGAVVVLHFLDRTLFDAIQGALAPGGILAFKTHLRHPLRPAGSRPRRAEFLLEPGELLGSFPGLSPLAYREWAGPEGAFAALLARRPPHSS